MCKQFFAVQHRKACASIGALLNYHLADVGGRPGSYGKLTVVSDNAVMSRHPVMIILVLATLVSICMREADALPSGVVPAAAPDIDPSLFCQAAISMAESAKQTPPGLLRAIGTVESGRRDPVSGQLAPWPWTIDANGNGHVYQTEAEAVTAARQFEAQGINSLDIGCMQVNLKQHPSAFTSLAEAFDPMSNVLYAANFLRRLKGSQGTWQKAVAAYHSQTPDLGIPYASKVMARWQGRVPSGLPLVQTASTPILQAGLPHVLGPGHAVAGAAAGDAAKPRPKTKAAGQTELRRFGFGGFAFAPLHGHATILPAMAPGGGAATRIGTPGIAGSEAIPGRGLSAYRRAPIPISGSP